MSTLVEMSLLTEINRFVCGCKVTNNISESQRAKR